MKTKNYESIEAIYGGKGIRFIANISGRKVGIDVHQNDILELAELTIKAGGYIGHGLWHKENPEKEFPCQTCKNIINQ